jgi:ribulose-phosphate 3-epimerase
MVNHPEKVIEDWLKAGAKRIIVHAEAMIDESFVLAKCKEYGAEVMLAANPETPAERLLKHKDDFKYFQLLGVKPGWAGQNFRPEVINKLKLLRKQAPDAIIEVDGGINPETARLVKEAGADIAVSASYIFGSNDSKSKFEELLRA